MADTEYLTREVAALRIAVGDMATRDFVRSELRQLLEELEERRALGTEPARDPDADAGQPGLDVRLGRYDDAVRSWRPCRNRRRGTGSAARPAPLPRSSSSRSTT